MAWPWAAGEPITAGGLNSLHRFAHRVSDSPPRNNTTAIATDTVLTLTGLPTNTVFTFASFINYDTNDTAKIVINFTAPAGSSFTWVPQGLATSVTSGDGIMRMPTTGLFSRALSGGGGANTVATPTGILITGNTVGDFALQYGQNAATAVDTFIRAGSWILLTKVGTV